jgi:hypothetical protein
MVRCSGVFAAALLMLAIGRPFRVALANHVQNAGVAEPRQASGASGRVRGLTAAPCDLGTP